MDKIKAILAIARTWAPVLSVLGLTAVTILKTLGQVQAAGAVDLILKILGLVITDPTMAASVTAMAGASYKTFKLTREAIAAR